MLSYLHQVELGPSAEPEQVAEALDAVATACSPHRDIAVNPAKMLAIALADANPVVWGGSTLAARAARRVAESIRHTSGRSALAGDAEHLLPVIEAARQRDVFVDPFAASGRVGETCARCWSCSTTAPTSRRSASSVAGCRPQPIERGDPRRDGELRRRQRGRALRLAAADRHLRRRVPAAGSHRGLTALAQETAQRDPWLDNAKMALVTLVVIGHAWTLLPDDAVNRHLYDFLYAWHIPAFVLVTGYLSRGFDWTGPRLWQLVRTVAVPYVLFECAFGLFRVYVGGEKLEDLFLDPHWPLWYLPALFLWRLMTPIFRGLPGGLLLALVISLAAGVWVADTLDLARVLGLLPFFVLGLKATPERLERLRSALGPGGGRGGARRDRGRHLVHRQLGLHRVALLPRHVRRADHLRPAGGRHPRRGAGDRLLGALAFLALVPRLDGWFSRMGSATLIVYLFHGFAVKGAEFAGFQGWAGRHEVWSLVLTTLARARPVAAAGGAAGGLAADLPGGPVRLRRAAHPAGGGACGGGR